MPWVGYFPVERGCRGSAVDDRIIPFAGSTGPYRSGAAAVPAEVIRGSVGCPLIQGRPIGRATSYIDTRGTISTPQRLSVHGPG